MTHSSLDMENLAVLSAHDHWPMSDRRFNAKRNLTRAEQDWCIDNYACEPTTWAEATGMLGYDPRKQLHAERTKARDSEQYKQHGDAIEAARNAAKAAGWPALTGTTRQKYWALQLRAKMVISLPAELRDWAVHNLVHATWWIEQRKCSTGELRKLVTAARDKAAAEQAKAAQEREEALAREEAWLAAEARKQVALEQRDIAIAAERADALSEYLPRVQAAMDAATSPPAGYSPKGLKVADGEVDGIGRVRVFRHEETRELSAMLGAGKSAQVLAAI